jgi:hypothetical protein
MLVGVAALWTGLTAVAEAQSPQCPTSGGKVIACVSGAPLRTAGRVLFIENPAQAIDISVEATGSALATTSTSGSVGPTTTNAGRLTARWTPSQDHLIQYLQTDSNVVAAIAVVLPALPIVDVSDTGNDQKVIAHVDLGGLGKADVTVDVTSPTTPIARFATLDGSTVSIDGTLRLDNPSIAPTIKVALPGGTSRSLSVTVAPTGITAQAAAGAGTFSVGGVEFDASTLAFSTKLDGNQAVVKLDGASSATAFLGNDASLHLLLTFQGGQLVIGCPTVSLTTDKPIVNVDSGILTGLHLALHRVASTCTSGSFTQLVVDAAVSLGNLTLPPNTTAYLRVGVTPNQPAAISFVDAAGQSTAPPTLSLSAPAPLRLGSLTVALSHLALDPSQSTKRIRFSAGLDVSVGSIDVFKTTSNDFALDVAVRSSEDPVQITCLQKPPVATIPLPSPFNGNATLQSVCDGSDGTGTLVGISSGAISIALNLGDNEAPLDITLPAFQATKGKGIVFAGTTPSDVVTFPARSYKFAGMTGTLDKLIARYDNATADIVVNASGSLAMEGPLDKTTLAFSGFAYGFHAKTITPPSLRADGGFKIMGFTAHTCDTGVTYANSVLNACVALTLPVHFKRRVNQFDLTKPDPGDPTAITSIESDAPTLEIRATRDATKKFTASMSLGNDAGIACLENRDRTHEAEELGVKYGAHFGIFDGCISRFDIRRGSLTSIDTSTLCSATGGSPVAQGWTFRHPDDVAVQSSVKFASIRPTDVSPTPPPILNTATLGSDTAGEGYMVLCGDIHFDRFLPPGNYASLEAAFNETIFVGAARLNDVTVNVLGGTVKITSIRIAMTPKERSVHSESTISVGNGPQGYPVSFTDLGFRFKRNAVEDQHWNFEPIVVVDKRKTLFDIVPRVLQDFIAMWAARGFRFRL